MTGYTIFYIGLSLFIVHEMDAIRRHEWRMMIINIKDELAYIIFTILHIPIFILIFFGIADKNDTLILILSTFFVIHIFLHIVFIKHEKNEFNSMFSWLIITGIFLSGLIFLSMRLEII
jgi:hypothetical protein